MAERNEAISSASIFDHSCSRISLQLGFKFFAIKTINNHDFILYVFLVSCNKLFYKMIMRYNL